MRTASTGSSAGVEPRLVGRAAELDRLAGWVSEVAAGRGLAVLVKGEPGIGKSALLSAAAGVAAEAGCTVYQGSGEELGQAFPLRPLLDAFGVRESPVDPRRQDVLRALRGQPADALAAAAGALLDLVDHVCAQSPAVLVVDDLHWADAATVSVCHRLAGSTMQRPLLLIGAMRPLPRRDDLEALGAEVGRDHLLRLGPLPRMAVRDLVTDLAGGRPGPGLVRLAGDASGNPLYVTELVGALDRGDGLVRTGGTVEVTGGPAPATLTGAINDRLRFLPEPTRHVLQVAALLGGEFTADELAVVISRRPAELAQPLAEARTAGVLADAGARMAFRHPLIRAALYDDLPPNVRGTRHRDAAHALHRAGAGPERVAFQLLPALAQADQQLRPGPDDWIVHWLLDVAAELVGEASAVAVRLLRAAVAQLPAADPRRHVLVSHLAKALGYQNENAAVETLVGQTLPHVTDSDVLVTLFDALAMSRGATRERLPETLTAIGHALATVPGLTEMARNRLHAIAARVQGDCADLDSAERAARLSLAEGMAATDRWAVTWSANTVANVLIERGDSVAALKYLDQGLTATDGQPDLIDARLLLLINRGDSLMRLDRVEEARATFTAAQALAERSGKIQRLAWAQSCLCELSYEIGRWDDALAEAELPDGVEDALSACPAVAALILMHRQQMAAARRHLAIGRRLAERLEFSPNLWVLADALEREIPGDPAEALAALRAGLARATRPGQSEPWLADIVRLAVGQGDRETAAEAAGRAEEFMAASSSTRRAAAVAHCQGLLAADPGLLRQAADGYATAGRSLPRAQALEAAAALLAERGEVSAARQPYLAAMDGYAALGAAWDLTRARARFRPYGLRRPTRRLNRPTTGWAALTPAEAKVAELVAAGRSNPEIAEELVVARQTVAYHVGKVLAKLQLRSRVDLALAAAARSQQAKRRA